MKAQHEEETTKYFQCNVCAFRTKSKFQLKYHQARIHKIGKLVKCDYCGYQIANNALLNQHVRLKHLTLQKKTLICDICDKHLSSKPALKFHMKQMHTVEKPFQCDLCGYSCKLATALHRHQKCVHSDEKGHECEMCGKAFNTRASMLRHVSNIHQREHQSELKCDKCDFKSIHISSLNRHIKLQHETPRTKCDICGVSLAAACLKSHMKRIHEDKSLSCPKCNFQTSIKTDYLNHIQNKHSN